MATADDTVAAMQTPLPELSEEDENALLGLQHGEVLMDIGNDGKQLPQGVGSNVVVGPVGHGKPQEPGQLLDRNSHSAGVDTVGVTVGLVVVNNPSNTGHDSSSKPVADTTEDGKGAKPKKPSGKPKKKKKKKDKRSSPEPSEPEASAASEEVPTQQKDVILTHIKRFLWDCKRLFLTFYLRKNVDSK